MAIDYPNGTDTFNEPSLPEYTSLSSAGTGTRAHVDHHRDLGDAVEALQRHAAKKGHDHSGDGDDTSKGAKLSWLNTHQPAAAAGSLGAARGYSDTDLGELSIHHTLGTGEYQAAPGNHNHQYNTLLGIPLQACLSSSRPVSPTAGMLIYETDTNQIRVWNTFAQNQLNAGLNSVENFNQGVNNNDLGSRWQQVYYATNKPIAEIFPSLPWATEESAQGKMATPDGQTASWIDAGSFTEQSVARRVHSADAVTQSDDQVLSFKTGSTVIEDGDITILPRVEGATNDFYLRMSSDSQSYWRFRLGFKYIKVFATTTGRAGEFFVGGIDNVITNLANMEWRIELKDRTLRFYRLGELLGAVTDSQARTSKGANFRGWGIGMQAGRRVFGQTTPANIDWVQIADLGLYQSIYRWTLLPAAAVPSCRLVQKGFGGSTGQKLSHLGTILQWSEAEEDNFGFWTPDAPSQITASEPGLYNVTVAIQWDPQFSPDVGIVILMLNNQETAIREQRWIKGSDAVPGFSQTVSFNARIRLAVNDTLSVKVRHGAVSSVIDKISTYFDSSSKIASRIDVTYVSP